MFSIPYDIKEKLHNDDAQINIRIHFPNGERSDICNDLIVSGSAKLTESLCSQNELKFGLCESPVFECETVKVGNIKGATFDLTYEILCEPNVAGSVWKTDIQQFVFEIPMGKFVVQSCERQADLQHRKIVAYGGGAATNWEMPNTLRLQGLSDDPVTEIDISSIIATKFKNEVEKEMYVDERDTTLDINVENIRVEYATNGNSVLKNAIIRMSFETLMDIDSVINDMKKHMPISPYVENALRKRIPRVRYGNQNIGIKNGEQIFSISFYHFPDFSIPIRIYTTDGELSYDMVDRDSIKFEKMISNIPPYNVSVDKKTFQDFLKIDLLSIFEAILEINGKIGRVGRNNELELIDIKKQFYLLPNDDLKPAEQLKPLGVVGDSVSKSMYSDCWYDENYTKPYGAIYCQYKDKKNEQQGIILYCSGYDDKSDVSTYQMYDISSNEIIKNSTYTEAEIVAIMQNIANAISNVTYVPVDAKTVALPYVECGDTLEVLTENNDSINTIVLKRVLSGESYVVDEFISK